MADENETALAVEAAALNLQNAINSVIDRGNTPIQQFYNNSSILVTGGLGFLGKQLIEKLFRSCEIKKMFVLIRPKRSTIKERLEHALNDPVFDSLYKKQPGFAKKLVAVRGNVAEAGLGLSAKDTKMLSEQVDVIFHLAVNIRHNEPLRSSVLVNVRGTREIVNLARYCKKLRNIVHVSTAYANAKTSNKEKVLFEQFYPCPLPPDFLIRLVQTVEESMLIDMTPILIKNWPNTYTFTKAVAEEVIRIAAADLPVCVVRPTIVAASYCEPIPGWLDLSCVFGPSGVQIGAGLGALHVIHIEDMNHKLPIAPVDIVNNAIIAAGWDSAVMRKKLNTAVYTIGNAELGMDWKFIRGIIDTECQNYVSPNAVWYCHLILTQYGLIYWLLSWLLHYIPAYFLDGTCIVMRRRPKKVKSFVKLFEKIEKIPRMFNYYYKNKFVFKDDHLRAMISRMSPEDKLIYNCDLRTVDFKEYVKIWTLGIKKYIYKESLKYSPGARRNQLVFRIFNYLFGLIYVYMLWQVLCVVYKVFSCVV